MKGKKSKDNKMPQTQILINNKMTIDKNIKQDNGMTGKMIMKKEQEIKIKGDDLF